MLEKTCICRNPACKGLSAGFAMLGDPRGGFVRLPRFVPNPGSEHDVERNAQRAAYLRELRPGQSSEKETMTMAAEAAERLSGNHVAIHHFDPRIVADLTPQRRFPKVLSEQDMDQLGVAHRDEDRVLDCCGFPTGFFVFIPSYPIESAKSDLKRLLGICQTVNKNEKKKKHHVNVHHQFALDLTNVSKGSPTSSQPSSPTPGAAFLDSDSEEENADSVNGKKYLPWHLKLEIHPAPPSPSRKTLAEF